MTPVLYMLAETEGRYVKVGYSKSPQARLSIYRHDHGWEWCHKRTVGPPRQRKADLFVARTWACEPIGARLIEGHCHRALRRAFPKDKYGEWYAVPTHEAVPVIEFTLAVANGIATRFLEVLRDQPRPRKQVSA
jgi:hypothetical protein